MSLKSRRRIFLHSDIYKKSIVTVDKDLINRYADGYKYYFIIRISNQNYWYMSNYPFYAHTSNDGVLLLLPNDVYRNSESFNRFGVYGYKNNIKYCKDYGVRSLEVIANIKSNYPIYEW